VHKGAAQAVPAHDVRYRLLLDNICVGIFHSIPGGRFTEVNTALVRMLGYESADEVLELQLPGDLYVNPTDRERL